MGRPRGFDEATAVAAASELFAEHGYEGTSVDDLVRRLGVHRGSLYGVFGSKRALYLRVLDEHVTALQGVDPQRADLTLLLRAALERAPVDPDAAAVVARGFGALAGSLPAGAPTTLAQLVGEHVLRAAAPARPEERP